MTEMNIQIVTWLISIAALAVAWYYKHKSDKNKEEIIEIQKTLKKYNRKIDANNIFMKFQERFSAINTKFPYGVNDYNWVPQSDNDKRNVVAYWLLVKDEYETCRLSEVPIIKNLWLEGYVPKIKDAMKRKGFTNELKILLKSEGFLGKHPNFKSELNEIYKSVNGNDIV